MICGGEPADAKMPDAIRRAQRVTVHGVIDAVLELRRLEEELIGVVQADAVSAIVTILLDDVVIQFRILAQGRRVLIPPEGDREVLVAKTHIVGVATEAIQIGWSAKARAPSDTPGRHPHLPCRLG